jgi:hypothetical protein
MRKKLSKERINDELIDLIRDKMPATDNMANLLTSILNIGKEAVYRRLRNEVPFTFTEASILSKALGISLDSLASVTSGNSQHTLINMHVIDYANPIETYYQSLNNSLESFLSVQGDTDIEWFNASNVVPQAFYMDHDYLSKFLLYKWMYQHTKIKHIKYFSGLEIPEKVKAVQQKYVETTKSIPAAYFIWDRMIFLSLINDIKYFYDINLVTDVEKNILKKEFLQMIDILEKLAAGGKHENGASIFIYISNINFEASYSYLCSANHKHCFIRVFAINFFSTKDETLFEYQKDWIQSLRKYSTLITVSGEMQRIQFFEKQRSYIHKML